MGNQHCDCLPFSPTPFLPHLPFFSQRLGLKILLRVHLFTRDRIHIHRPRCAASDLDRVDQMQFDFLLFNFGEDDEFFEADFGGLRNFVR